MMAGWLKLALKILNSENKNKNNFSVDRRIFTNIA